MIPQNSKSIAFWRLPLQTEINLCAEFDGITKSGFKVAPFDAKAHPEFLIPADFECRFSYTEFQKLEFGNEIFNRKESSLGSFSEKKEYIELVQEAISELKNQNISKVVTSRRLKFNALNPQEIRDSFLSLCEKYPDAFVFCFSHPASGTWMGASPETLIQCINKKYKTMSLAGTLNIDSSDHWTAKEIEEQSLVTEYILTKLKSLNASNTTLSGPRDKNAGQIKHLCTEIEFNSTLNPAQIAKHLHPTPAISGMPVLEALKLISKLEGYDREYYTGYCGPIDLNHSTEFFVNLRCIQFCKETSIIYSGGGVLKNSNPESEWLETVRKSETVLGALEKM